MMSTTMIESAAAGRVDAHTVASTGKRTTRAESALNDAPRFARVWPLLARGAYLTAYVSELEQMARRSTTPST